MIRFADDHRDSVVSKATQQNSAPKGQGPSGDCCRGINDACWGGASLEQLLKQPILYLGKH